MYTSSRYPSTTATKDARRRSREREPDGNERSRRVERHLAERCPDLGDFPPTTKLFETAVPYSSPAHASKKVPGAPSRLLKWGST